MYPMLYPGTKVSRFSMTHELHKAFDNDYQFLQLVSDAKAQNSSFPDLHNIKLIWSSQARNDGNTAAHEASVKFIGDSVSVAASKEPGLLQLFCFVHPNDTHLVQALERPKF